MVGSVIVVDSQQQYQPEEVHRIVSQCAYGEEDEAFLESIGMEIALQVPWTTQLRLCLRRRSLRLEQQDQPPNIKKLEQQQRHQQLENILLPHVWNKVHKLQVDDDEGHFGLVDDTWKQDVMIQSWNLTRFHVQRDLRVVSGMLRVIMEKIDSLLGIINQHPVLALPFDGYWPQFDGTMRKALQEILRGDHEDDGKDADDRQQEQSMQQQTPRMIKAVSIHPHFSNWIATKTHLIQEEGQDQTDMYLELCRQIGLKRTRLKRIREQLNNLPLRVLSKGLTELQLGENSQIRDTDAQKGRALLTALLKQNGVNIHLHPLPQELLMLGCSNNPQQLKRGIESYLLQGLPNVNNLVVFLWTQQQQQRIEHQLVIPFASWLPVEPIVPLLQRNIVTSQSHDMVERAIDFFLGLPWEPHHLETAFAPCFAHTHQHLPIPTDVNSLKEACRRRSRTQLLVCNSDILDRNQKPRLNARPIPSPSIHELVNQVWGSKTEPTTTKVLDYVEYNMYSVDSQAMDEDQDGLAPKFQTDEDDENEDDDYFDETDDRVLLL